MEQFSKKLSVEDFLEVTGYPIFDRIKQLVDCLEVKYIRCWSTDAVTTAEIHISHPVAKHITIGTGKHYSGRTRVAISLKETSLFEKLYGKLPRESSSTYVKYNDEGFEMLQHIAGNWEKVLSQGDEDLINTISVVTGSKDYTEYEKSALTKQRIGHSTYAKKVKACAGNRCLINSNISRNLIASHIKPWADSENHEKVDIANGLCLSPNYDGLFEDGIISFNDDGNIIINGLSRCEMKAYGLTGKEIITVNKPQIKYLSWHRKHRLKS
ncbi:HNH endonuclease [Photobacterium sanguinicancri]|uniref:HNH endonuclease n=1 Tax=Photobacterium sanguinicancri TaxID=875932 RepID=A0ABX4FRT1_9GAMM|nr:HNH endonuclease [Photobacterium sanguinicancri]OZS41606.1 HNH endonuclease [Photobacterium sanguinicancri]